MRYRGQFCSISQEHSDLQCIIVTFPLHCFSCIQTLHHLRSILLLRRVSDTNLLFKRLATGVWPLSSPTSFTNLEIPPDLRPIREDERYRNPRILLPSVCSYWISSMFVGHLRTSHQEHDGGDYWYRWEKALLNSMDYLCTGVNRAGYADVFLSSVGQTVDQCTRN